MKWQIISIGKPALPWARAAIDDYLLRLKRTANPEVVILKDGTPSQNTERTLEASAGTWRVVLDEKGRQVGSAEFAQWITKQEGSGRKRVSFLIGGADGHSEEVKAAADETWSLSKMTLQHELAYVVFLEQLYRACSINLGTPYHRP
jgi:23S rRNA (pseudouridine1915-N3)-methyltransferase